MSRLELVKSNHSAELDNAPTPWRSCVSFSEVTAILDANGRTLGVVRREIADLIITAVNGMEKRP